MYSLVVVALIFYVAKVTSGQECLPGYHQETSDVSLRLKQVDGFKLKTYKLDRDTYCSMLEEMNDGDDGVQDANCPNGYTRDILFGDFGFEPEVFVTPEKVSCYRLIPRKCPPKSTTERRDGIGWNQILVGRSGEEDCFMVEENPCPCEFHPRGSDCSRGYHMDFSVQFSGDQQCVRCVENTCPTNSVDCKSECAIGYKKRNCEPNVWRGEEECCCCEEQSCPDKWETIPLTRDGEFSVNFLFQRIGEMRERGFLPSGEVRYSGRDHICLLFKRLDCPEGFEIPERGEECMQSQSGIEIGQFDGWSGGDICTQCICNEGEGWYPIVWGKDLGKSSMRIEDRLLRDSIQARFDWCKDIEGFSPAFEDKDTPVCWRCRADACPEGTVRRCECHEMDEFELITFSGNEECGKCNVDCDLCCNDFDEERFGYMKERYNEREKHRNFEIRQCPNTCGEAAREDCIKTYECGTGFVPNEMDYLDSLSNLERMGSDIVNLRRCGRFRNEEENIFSVEQEVLEDMIPEFQEGRCLSCPDQPSISCVKCSDDPWGCVFGRNEKPNYGYGNVLTKKMCWENRNRFPFKDLVLCNAEIRGEPLLTTNERERCYFCLNQGTCKRDDVEIIPWGCVLGRDTTLNHGFLNVLTENRCKDISERNPNRDLVLSNAEIIVEDGDNMTPLTTTGMERCYYCVNRGTFKSEEIIPWECEFGKGTTPNHGLENVLTENMCRERREWYPNEDLVLCNAEIRDREPLLTTNERERCYYCLNRRTCERDGVEIIPWKCEFGRDTTPNHGIENVLTEEMCRVNREKYPTEDLVLCNAEIRDNVPLRTRDGEERCFYCLNRRTCERDGVEIIPFSRR